MKREDAIKLKCPKCGARPNRACVGARGDRRMAPHIERFGRGARLGSSKPKERKMTRTHLDILEEMAENEKTRFLETIDFCRKKTQSPIEELFLAGLMQAFDVHHVDARQHITTADYEFPNRTGHPFGGWTVYMQAMVGQYRADFLIIYESNREEEPRKFIAVECDGHNFHERTKQQAAYDRARDRHFTQLGIKVARFTGSEIWANPIDCACQALDMVDDPDALLGRDGFGREYEP